MNLLNKLKDLRTDIVWAEIAQNEFAEYQKNANEVEHTANTWYWKELVEVDALSHKIYSAVPEHAVFLDKLSEWFHGNDMWISVKVPIKWEVGYARWNPEWTTWAALLSQWTNKLWTWDVTITQVPLILSVDISKRLQNHSVGDVEEFVSKSISASMTRTIEWMILNWDTVTAWTWNVNSDDQAPATTFASTWGANDHRLLLDNGIRKLALSWTANVDYKEVWTIEFEDFINVRAMLWNNGNNLDWLLLLMNWNTYHKTLVIDEFKNQYQNGISSTVVDWKLQAKLAWVEYVVTDEFWLTEDDWKQSWVTPANNTKGWFAYVVKSAVQWGYGQSIEIDSVKIPWKWVTIIATAEVWFTIVNKKAGQAAWSVALWINATV